ncbi:FtsH protease activity modulator HflK [Massilia sp. W12]|uniref:FtsH protease activity modulator HflK n=1 Tax=Massilia sp. W12 TaxID=3126507 RepID=UPI0030D38DAC
MKRLSLSNWLGRLRIGRRAPFFAADGNRPGDGPPDLDQLWRDFNRRLSSMFGQGPRPPSGNNNEPAEIKGVGVGIGVVMVVAGFLWLSSGFFIVLEGETAVVLTFGKYSRTAPAGFNWRWPSPIESHQVVNVSRMRTVEVGYRRSAKNKEAKEALMLTDDENIVEVQFAVQYKLKNPSDWIFNNRETRDDDDSFLRQIAETSVREVVGKGKMDYVLYEGREKVAYDVSQLMQQILDRYKSGVQVVNVTMQNVQPPEQVQNAFDDAVKAGQDMERLKNEGAAYANDVIPKARGQAARMLLDAQAHRSRVVETASGDAARFKQVVTEYAKAPTVTRDRMYLETMQQVFNNVTKVMVDSKTGNNLINLPLDKLIQGAAADHAAQQAVRTQQAASGQQAPEQNVDVRARESRKADVRERESR